MTQYEKVVDAIYDAIGEVNATLSLHEPLDRSPATVLVGPAGHLDSLGFVSLAVAVEEQVARRFGRDVSVIDIVADGGYDDWTVAMLGERIATIVV